MSARFAKLRTMDLREIGWRGREWLYRRHERRQVLRGEGSRPEDGPAGASLRGVFAALRDRDGLRALLLDAYAEQCDATLRRADEVLAGRIELFGTRHQLHSEIDWHADPVSGWQWPRSFHGDIPLAGHGDVDVKHVWELNRHQFLVDVAKASFLTGEQRYADSVAATVSSWLEQNPVGIGINWAGPLEVAYRGVSWLWSYELLGDRLDDRRRRAWAAGILSHARFLHHHLERYSSPYNHLMGEAAALYMIGVSGSGFPESRHWRRRGRGVLESALPAQFYADGGSVEQAVVYHHATLGFYLLAALVGRTAGEEFPAAIWDAIERATEFSMWMTQPDGCQPAIGDNDDARPIRFEHLPTWDFRHFQSLGAVLFDRSDFRFVGGRFHEDAVWLLGPAGRARFDSMPSSPPPALSRVLDTSGYVVLRSSWGRDANYVCFDAGEQAGGLRTDDIANAAHGHSDCLSVVASLAGKPILVDAGFLTYNGDVGWERFFRETAAHNTVRVDGLDQSDHLEKMAWRRVPRAAIEAADVSANALSPWARGTHDGFVRQANGVVHSRTVILDREIGLALVDRLAGAGSHAFELVFQLSPELDARICGNQVILDSELVLACSSDAVLDRRLSRGQPGIEGGWVAPRLGVRQPAFRLTVRGGFEGQVTVVTLLTWRTARAAAFPPILPQCLRAKALPERTDGADILGRLREAIRDASTIGRDSPPA